MFIDLRNLQDLGSLIKAASRGTISKEEACLKAGLTINVSPWNTLLAERKRLRRRLSATTRRTHFKLMHMRKKSKSKLFNDQKYKRFLDIVLNRFNDSQGIVGAYIYNEAGELQLSSESEDILKTAREVLSHTFFSPRVTPPEFANTGKEDDYKTMPDWFKHIFKWDRINQQKKEYEPVTKAISEEEVSQAIRKMAPHKAGGPSGVTADMLKAAPPIIINLLAEYCTMALRAGDIPHNAKDFNLWCIDKAPGAGKWISADLSAKLGVRPISLFEVTTKLLERILAARLNGVINKHKFLHKAQMGFSENISAVEAMLLYMHIVEDAHINKKNIYLSSNDCSQAYDSVAPWVMKLIYQYHGFPSEIVTLLHNMAKGQSGTILTGVGPTDPFEKLCGLGQGSSLAPLKWNLYLDPLLRWLDELEDKYVINGEGIAVGAFADDTVFISTTHEGYLERMRRGGTYFNFFGTEFN